MMRHLIAGAAIGVACAAAFGGLTGVIVSLAIVVAITAYRWES